MKMFGSQEWKLGQDAKPPPKWLLREFSVALHQMARKGEAAHSFNSKGVTFVVVMLPTDKEPAFRDALEHAYKTTVSAEARRLDR